MRRRKRNGSVSVPRGKRTQVASDSDNLAENWSFFDELRDELLVEILIRLPSVDAVRFKAVCKRWHDLISDRDNFITPFLHHRHLLQADRPFSLVFQLEFLNILPLPGKIERKSLVQMISEDQFRRKLKKGGIIDMGFLPCVPRHIPFKPIITSGPLEFQLEASCADFLLCSYNNPSTYLTVYHLCNMVTKQWVALPPVRMNSQSAAAGFLFDQGQAQSELSGRYNYRLVRLPRHRLFRASIHFDLKIQIFSSEEGRWTNSAVPLPRSLNACASMMNRMIAFNRMLHMLTDDGVVVFDPFRETKQVVSRIIDLPVENRFFITSSGICFGTSRGHLRFSIIKMSSTTLDIWELEDYKNGKWFMAHKICTENIKSQLKIDFGFKVLAFHPNNQNIMYLGADDYVVECYVEQENKLKVLYRLQQRRDMKDESLNWDNTFPLVHHWWPLPQPSLPHIEDGSSEGSN